MKRYVRPNLLFSSLALLCATATAKANVAADVTTLMNSIRSHSPADIAPLRNAPPLEVLEELRKYANDPDRSVRSAATGIASGFSLRYTDPKVRRQAAQLLVDSGVSDPDPGLARHAAQDLLDFNRADFTDEMRQVINQAVNVTNPEFEVVLLVGVADVRAAEGRLRQMAREGSWTAQLALARMGDKAAIANVLAKAEATTAPDIPVAANGMAITADGKKTYDATGKSYEILKLVRNLAYVRQPEVVEFLLSELFSDKVLPGNGSDVPSSSYAKLIADELDGVIVGFPDKAKRATYKTPKEELAALRAWADKRGAVTSLSIKR